MILEVMGRSAGWIAIESGIAGGADVIAIPEIPIHMESVLNAIETRDAAGSKFSIIVVAEGAAPAGGERMQVEGTSGPGIRFAGMGNWLGEQLGELTDHEVRVTVLGHVQRGGSPSPFDRILATRFGVEAVRFIGQGRFGEMVAYHGTEVAGVPLTDAVGQLRLVPPDGGLAQTARGLGICLCD
jgi:6-phosphofructokinase 1